MRSLYRFQLRIRNFYSVLFIVLRNCAIITGWEIRPVTSTWSNSKRLIAGAVKSSMDAHGKVDPGSVAKRVAGQMWARTIPKGHADLAAYVVYVRGELGLTQQELADKIECHQVTIARWESGEQAPRGKRLEALIALAKTLPGS